LSACGRSHHSSATVRAPTAAPPSPAPPPPHGPAFGLTEDNADLLWSPAAAAPASAAGFLAARQELTALHPHYLRLLVDWAALQPDPANPPALEAAANGCARQVGPCGAYAGIREELAAIASQQRAAGGQGDFQVVLEIFGTPSWAARAPSGCERGASGAFSRPLSAAAIAAYRALIHSLLQLGAQQGVALTWWSPWNEPNDPVFISPQRAACSAAAPPLAPPVYTQLAQAMSAELQADGGVHHLLLGELNAFQSGSPDRTSIAQFISSLPDDVICLSDVWSIHAYARRVSTAPALDPVKALQAALDTRGACGRAARIWVTEAGVGAPHPGRRRPPGQADEHAGCVALAEQLIHWYDDPRVDAVFQYSFREDPAFPVGLLSADLTHVYPAYNLWLDYTRTRAAGRTPPSPADGCA
jgi:hypothetical protein